jgi:carboxylesterase type B
MSSSDDSMFVDNSVIIEDSKEHLLTIPDQGTLKGLAVLDGKTKKEKCYRYSGIRYAQPPTGDLRWRRPVSLPERYNYDGDYTQFKTVCPQPVYPGLEKIQHPNTVYDEDCLYLNIWVPAGEPPKGGWPVMYFIHGGFLQVGNPSQNREADPQDLQSEGSPARYIVVAPGYRLNLFGFLSSKELLDEDPQNTNFGFWDQRKGLEWVYNTIHHFGGDKNNVSVAGLSAGSYSAIFQLQYELYHPKEVQIIKKVHLISNGLAVQPKSVEESQEQFDELLRAFNIPFSLPSADKLAKLREIPFKDLANKIMSLKLHTFRAVTDNNNFVSTTLLKDIISGRFGELFNQSGRSIIIGDVVNELSIYKNTNPPESAEALERELNNYYPHKIVKALINLYPSVPDTLKSDSVAYLEKTKELFGTIVSDMQVYSSERILIESLIQGGVPLDRIHRYKVGYRARFFDKYTPPEEKVPHGGDMGIWFYTVIDGIEDDEKPAHIKWLKPVEQFMYNKPVDWGTTDKTQYRIFNPDGSIEIRHDDQWNWAMKVRDAIKPVVDQS